MLHEVLKFVTYLSIITTTTSSSFLTKDTLVNYRRASPSSISSDQSPQLINDGEGFEWTESSNDELNPQSDYLIPQLVNVNNMLYSHLSNDNGKIKHLKRGNTRKLSQKVRNKKDNNNKVINSKNNKLTNLIKNYDNLNNLHNIESTYSDESNSVRNDSNINRINEADNNKVNQTSSEKISKPSLLYHSTLTNEYPMKQISAEAGNDRELQQLFGIEGARKYQSFQLQQQTLGNSEQPILSPNVERIEIEQSKKKRNGDSIGEEMQDVSGAMVNQIMPRTTRRQREYDVPLIREFKIRSFFCFRYCHRVFLCEDFFPS